MNSLFLKRLCSVLISSTLSFLTMAQINLINQNSTWNYLDDGYNQRPAWVDSFHLAKWVYFLQLHRGADTKVIKLIK